MEDMAVRARVFLFTAAEAEQRVFFNCSCSTAHKILLHQHLYCLEIMLRRVLEDLLVLNLPQQQYISYQNTLI